MCKYLKFLIHDHYYFLQALCTLGLTDSIQSHNIVGPTNKNDIQLIISGIWKPLESYQWHHCLRPI